MNITSDSETKYLDSSRLFIGVVTCSDSATYTVQVAPKGQNNLALIQGVPLASVFAAHLGFKECYLPQPGVEVLCFRIDVGQCLIFGVIPPIDRQTEGGMMPARALIGGGDSTKDICNNQGYYGEGISKLKTYNSTRPTDVRQGEQVWTNEFGVMLGLFQSFAALKGSELAQVQTFFLDDLVRIVSHNFQHFTSMGEFKIYHDGKTLQMEVGMSHDPKETLMCQPQLNSENNTAILNDHKTPDKEDLNSFYGLATEKIVGIERLKAFIGTLGDFVNILIVKPAETIRSLDGEARDPDLGLSQVKLDTDGGIQLRSVKSIVLEKTQWIRVPTRVRSPEDPEGNTPDELPEKSAFEFNSELKYKDQPFMYFLQMRDYLAYINEDLGYKNFKALDKDFSVNSDYSKEEDITALSKVHPTHNVRYEKNNAYVGIMPNGGIVFKDAWGSAIVMEGGNIYFQPAKDEVHQPMRNFVVKAGKVFNVAAQNDIDMSSTRGSFRLKTEQAQYLYSDKSGILLHANGEVLSEVGPVDDTITQVGGVILHAPNTSVVSNSKYKLDRVEETFVQHADTMVSETDTALTTLSAGRITIFSKDDLLVNAVGLMSFVTEGDLWAFGQSHTIIGMEGQTYGKTSQGIPVEGLLTPDGITSFTEYVDQLEELHAQEFSPVFQEDENFEDIQFRFLSTGVYGISTGLDYIPQTVLQQEDDAFAIHNLRVWEEVAVNDTYPYPGADFKDCLVKGSISNLQNIDGELVNRTEDLTTIPELEIGSDIFTEYKTL